jgi:hypothetical protein
LSTSGANFNNFFTEGQIGSDFTNIQHGQKLKSKPEKTGSANSPEEEIETTGALYSP